MKEDIENLARNYLLLQLKPDNWLYEGKVITSYYSVNQKRYPILEEELESFVRESTDSYISCIKNTDDFLILLKSFAISY